MAHAQYTIKRNPTIPAWRSSREDTIKARRPPKADRSNRRAARHEILNALTQEQ